MKNASPLLILLFFVLFIQSCTAVRLSVDLSVSTDRKAIEYLIERASGIAVIKAELKLTSPEIAAPSIDAYLNFERGGFFRLTGLTPSGFTMFDIHIRDGLENNQIEGLPAGDMMNPELVRDVLDFYGGDSQADFTWFTEESQEYYIVSQLMSSGKSSYPVRRWWIDKLQMVIVKKELYSDNPDKQGVLLFEARYSDLRDIRGIMMPFNILIFNGSGSKAGRVSFRKIDFNQDGAGDEGSGN